MNGDVIIFSGAHQRIKFVFIYLYLFLIGTHTHLKIFNVLCIHTQVNKQGFIPFVPKELLTLEQSFKIYKMEHYVILNGLADISDY